MPNQEIDIPKVASQAEEAEGSCPAPSAEIPPPHFTQEPTPMTPITNERKTRKNRPGQFPKGTSGNPAGRPPGSRNRSTLLMEELLEGEGEHLVRKAIELASAGDILALRLCMDRLLPPRKDRTIQLNLPSSTTLPQISAALSTVVKAIGEGRITPNEGETLGNIFTMQTKVLETADLDRRITELEQAVPARKNQEAA
ncbi:MAG: DUF5681 domain-containing protein [Terriglobia bacterium]